MWICRLTRKEHNGQGNVEVIKKQYGAETLNDLIEILDSMGYLDDEELLEMHWSREQVAERLASI
jgi:hypothetical protein